jgi:hypothetical protein
MPTATLPAARKVRARATSSNVVAYSGAVVPAGARVIAGVLALGTESAAACRASGWNQNTAHANGPATARGNRRA